MLPIDRVLSVGPGVTPEQMQRLVAEYGYSRYLVTAADGTPTGYLHLKDVLDLEFSAHRSAPVPADRIRPVPRVREGDDAEDALRAMRAGRVHLALTTDAGDRVTGVVFLEDVGGGTGGPDPRRDQPGLTRCRPGAAGPHPIGPGNDKRRPLPRGRDAVRVSWWLGPAAAADSPASVSPGLACCCFGRGGEHLLGARGGLGGFLVTGDREVGPGVWEACGAADAVRAALPLAWRGEEDLHRFGDQLDQRHRRPVALAQADLGDPQVTALALGEGRAISVKRACAALLSRMVDIT